MRPQDELLIAEALVRFAGDARSLDTRGERAWELAEGIVADQGLPMDALATQIDEGWSGPA